MYSHVHKSLQHPAPSFQQFSHYSLGFSLTHTHSDATRLEGDSSDKAHCHLRAAY